MTSVPQAMLRIECAMSNPPRPISCAVMIDGKLSAIVALDELRRAAARLDELEGVGYLPIIKMPDGED
jgi:hypothetical protein